MGSEQSAKIKQKSLNPRIESPLMPTYLIAYTKIEKWILESRQSVPRKFVRVEYSFERFLKRYNLSYSCASFIRWVQKSMKFRHFSGLRGQATIAGNFNS